MRKLTFHHLASAGHDGLVARQVENVKAGAKRSQRVPKFVGKRGQKLILAAVGVLQGFLGTLPVRDVGDGAGHRGGPARVVALDDSQGGHPAVRAVGPDDAKLAGEDGAMIDRRTPVLEHPVAVVLVNKLFERFDGSLETAGGHAMDRMAFLRPGQSVG